MIKGEFLGGSELAASLAGKGQTLRIGLSTSIGRLIMSLLRRVKMDKLSGQALNVRTGRLRRSINSKMTGVNTDQVAGYVGTNVSYAHAHEFGFQGSVTVKEHLRTQVKAWGKSIEPKKVTVHAHQMKMSIPEHSFLRSALAEMDTEIDREISGAVKEILK